MRCSAAMTRQACTSMHMLGYAHSYAEEGGLSRSPAGIQTMASGTSVLVRQAATPRSGWVIDCMRAVATGAGIAAHAARAAHAGHVVRASGGDHAGAGPGVAALPVPRHPGPRLPAALCPPARLHPRPQVPQARPFPIPPVPAQIWLGWFSRLGSSRPARGVAHGEWVGA